MNHSTMMNNDTRYWATKYSQITVQIKFNERARASLLLFTYDKRERKLNFRWKMVYKIYAILRLFAFRRSNQN